MMSIRLPIDSSARNAEAALSYGRATDTLRATGWGVLLCLVLSACGTTRNETATAQPSVAPTTAATPKPDDNRVALSAEAIRRGQIETGEVTTQSFTQTIEAPGRLAFNEDAAARVGTIVSGRVTKVFATVGDAVSKGQPLVYLHSHELVDARAAAAKAAVIVADKQRALTFAKAEAERTERLLAAKAIAQREVAQAQAQVKADEAELAHAQAEKERADEFLEHLSVPHDSHDDIVISSPISGYVVKRDVSVGTVVNEASDLIQILDRYRYSRERCQALRTTDPPIGINRGALGRWPISPSQRIQRACRIGIGSCFFEQRKRKRFTAASFHLQGSNR